jgi:hypothetical protein
VTRNRLTVEELAKDALDVRELHQSVPQGIRVSWTRCHFGGFRPWLHCPHCERRVARLFKGFAGYCCRACCGNPIYETQRRSRKGRAYLQAYRIRQRLGGSRPVVDAIPPRPPPHGAEDLRAAVRASGAAGEEADRWPRPALRATVDRAARLLLI